MKKTCTVLLVENNPDDARLVELALEKSTVPHFLFVITGGLEAMSYLRGKGRYADRQLFPLPKLVLLDLGMPGVSGFDLLEQLRREPGLKYLPVTILSGSDYLRDVTRAYQLGANSFLVKPSNFEKFAAAIQETLEFWLGGGRLTGPPVYLQVPQQASAAGWVGAK